MGITVATAPSVVPHAARRGGVAAHSDRVARLVPAGGHRVPRESSKRDSFDYRAGIESALLYWNWLSLRTRARELPEVSLLGTERLLTTMAEKQTIIGRIAQLAKANINALLDRAEDPEKMLDQLVRDYTNAIAEAETAVAQTIGNLRMMEEDYNTDVATAQEWGRKAAAASKKADEMRAAGGADAQKWDDLAKVALRKQIEAEKSAEEMKPMLDTQRDSVEKLKANLNASRAKLETLRSQRDQLVARQRTAEAQAKLSETISSINVMDPSSELARFEQRVRQQEALVQGRAELAADSFDAQFEELELSSTDAEIEARLAKLKNNAD